MFETKCKCGNSDKITRNHHPMIDHQFKTMGKCLDAVGKARSHHLKLQDKSYSTPCAKRMVAVPFCSESYSGTDHIARTTKEYSRSLFGRSMITTGPSCQKERQPLHCLVAGAKHMTHGVDVAIALLRLATTAANC